VNPDLSTEPVEIAPSIHWVGKREAGSVFHANPYLASYVGQPDGRGPKRVFNLLIDPGSSSDFAFVRSKVEQVIGGLDRLSALFINHQDPDVGSSAPMILQRFAPQAALICSESTWRLVRHFNLGRDRFVNTGKHADGLRLPTGHRIIPVPTAYCHFVGAVGLYDPVARVLFSGDLFGGLTETRAQGLWADESDWAGVRAFHQLYMPTQMALRHAIRSIRALEPRPRVIAPQHGRLLRGPLIEEMMSRLETLEVGLDLMDAPVEEDPELLAAWSGVLARVLKSARSLLDEETVASIGAAPALRGRVELGARPPQIQRDGQNSVERVLALLTEQAESRAASVLVYEAVAAAEELGLPTPRVTLSDSDGAEEVPASTWSG
jgi:glyoxylase-like metal-dependent hydrolase (beta-lactamase superfamily II)